MPHRHRPAFSGAASALPFECAVYRAARATGKEVCRRWLDAIETQSEVKLERPTLHAAWTGMAVRSSQRRKKGRRRDSRKTGTKTHSAKERVQCPDSQPEAYGRTALPTGRSQNTDGYGSARSMRCGRRREYTLTPSKLASRRLTVPMLCSTHRNSGEPAWTSHGRYLDSM